MLFWILQLKAKSTSCVKIRQALVEHAVLNPKILKPNPQVMEKSTKHPWKMLFWI